MMKSILISLAVFFATLTVVSPSAFAIAVKANPKAARGCIPRVSLQVAQAEMKKFNLAAVNAKPEEIRTLGTGLFWVEKLAGGKPLSLATAQANPYSFRFANGYGVSRQTGGGIQITRNGQKNYGQNVAQLVHELGHFVGNNGGYEAYREAMKGRYCIVSSYSASRFNEQFAENFAAFVANPNIIKANKSVGCQRSYQFFSKRLFARGDLAEKCAVGTLKSDDYNM